MSRADEILSGKSWITFERISSMDDVPDCTGVCWGGPWDGHTLSDANSSVVLKEGTYRFVDGRWWWSGEQLDRILSRGPRVAS